MSQESGKGRQTENTRKGVRNHAEEADRKYEEVSQIHAEEGDKKQEEANLKSCRGGRQEVRLCEVMIQDSAKDGDRKYKELSQKSCRGGGQKVQGDESGIMQRRQTGSTRM